MYIFLVNLMKIGCDIGNVIRDNATGLAILDSIESLK